MIPIYSHDNPMKNHYSMVYKIPLKSPENPHERIPMDQKYQCTGHVQNTHTVTEQISRDHVTSGALLLQASRKSYGYIYMYII